MVTLTALWISCLLPFQFSHRNMLSMCLPGLAAIAQGPTELPPTPVLALHSSGTPCSCCTGSSSPKAKASLPQDRCTCSWSSFINLMANSGFLVIQTSYSNVNDQIVMSSPTPLFVTF